MSLKYMKSIVSVGVVSMMIGGCASTGTSNTTDGVVVGSLAGAAIGGLAGGDGRSAAIGAAVGALAGGAVGYSLDQQAKDIARSLGTGVNNDPLAYMDPNQDLIVSNNGKFVRIMFRERMMFPIDSAILTSSASYKVGKVGRILQQYPDTIVQVAGFTDNRGSYSYNKKLSVKRAETVSKRLYREHINNRSYTVGCSFDNPIVPNDTERNMALNRRVEIFLYPNNDVRVDPCRYREM
ncbi:Outer membrane lipoprotein omp16 precursor [hydrothermal vent metagenome]|uniref:Outer membrane lipoprotein omp16 n=1 Tax=hydrothermal vent metagenome TaxID=652676 RepID=A0A1W1BP50_9ZZZZ